MGTLTGYKVKCIVEKVGSFNIRHQVILPRTGKGFKIKIRWAVNNMIAYGIIKGNRSDIGSFLYLEMKGTVIPSSSIATTFFAWSKRVSHFVEINVMSLSFSILPPE